VRIETARVTVRYPRSRKPALDAVSLVVEEGSMHAVVGPNGSGKSTLLKAMLGWLKPLHGKVILGSRRLEEWPARERARNVGVVVQSESFPFELTVRDLVSMGRYPHRPKFSLAMERHRDRHRVVSAIVECRLEALADRRLNSLSGGELQRARIARALAKEPRLLVLDEPTSNLDLRHRMGIFGLLRNRADRGCTVLVITHEIELAARFVDRVTVLAEGRVVADGPPAQAVTGEVLTRTYRWPVSVTVEEDSGFRITPLSEGSAG